jgi:hypothetical protein
VCRIDAKLARAARKRACVQSAAGNATSPVDRSTNESGNAVDMISFSPIISCKDRRVMHVATVPRKKHYSCLIVLSLG